MISPTVKTDIWARTTTLILSEATEVMVTVLFHLVDPKEEDNRTLKQYLIREMLTLFLEGKTLACSLLAYK